MARTKAKRECRIVSKFKEEKLISLLRLTRKLSSCKFHQHMKVMQQLAAVFQSDEVPFSLMDILITGLCQRRVYEAIPKTLYDEIDSILPSDKELNLKDSVFESRLVEEQEDVNYGDGQLPEKKKELSMTLLRVPTDLQCHLFHFLHFKDLTNVQTACRALCIAARNPSAVLSLKFNPRLAKMGQFQNECYSRPRMLTIGPLNRLIVSHQLSYIGNEKWGNNVVDLRIRYYDADIDLTFPKLEKCEIARYPHALLNGTIASYHTLRELTLENITLTEDIIDRIRKFEDLEKLYLEDLSPRLITDEERYLEPIILPRLTLFSYQIPNDGFREFQRFLVGSNPDTVFEIDADLFYHQNDTSFASELPISKMSPIKELNVFGSRHQFFKAMTLWLRNAPSADFKLFTQMNVKIVTEIEDCSLDDIVSPLITVCQYVNKSKLELECRSLRKYLSHDMDEVVNRILKAPLGTFAEIKMEMRFDLFRNCWRNEDELYIEYLLDKLNQEESPKMDRKIVRSVVMRSIEDAETWMEPWLLFTEERMKQIGLEKLDVEFTCDLKPDYELSMESGSWSVERTANAERFEPVFMEIIGELLNDKVNYWNERGRQRISSTKEEQMYKVILALQV